MSRRHKHGHDQIHENAPGVAPGVAESELSEESGAEENTAAPAAAGAGGAADDPQREVAEWKDKYLRARAEMQNAVRRAANERDDAVRYANAGVLKDLLEVVDDFERAVAAAEQADSTASVIDGVKMVQEKLAKFLRDHQVEPIDAQDAPFDPMQHEALLQQPSRDVPAGTVLQQVQRGYRLRDRVLRPAKVIVATAPADEDGPGD
ncbi:MAG TPA: nucleotide exchange factor GrpE [Phycisphaerae bacterium]|nr:nucleotide exchange factor GrpE [Phycisphaerae bacterium]